MFWYFHEENYQSVKTIITVHTHHNGTILHDLKLCGKLNYNTHYYLNYASLSLKHIYFQPQINNTDLLFVFSLRYVPQTAETCNHRGLNSQTQEDGGASERQLKHV